ncbi:metallophosphoesterase [Marinobacterium weihaiense]|uniref:Metallophosphoesterase n=1 Tax=Marinobacterium weihaiense TaxID=2851016 RepID=A0ABS6M7Z9_9GAMM|nr:metallophosphoesterase [Marinobacterium weihaiense]MBV0932416.1 metallophosphoesterase [Marinobacterium weihaiense]
MSLRILQLSDCHLPEQAGEPFRGRDADRTLAALVAQLVELPAFDHLLLTGDLTHHAGVEAYRRLLSIIAPLTGTRHWLPGNHDVHSTMQAADAEGTLGRKQVDLGGDWTLLQLDSTASPDGRGGGSLAAAELDWLQRTLVTLRERHVLLALHHNPVATGSRWQDAIRLGNPDALRRILEPAPQVKGLVCGHLHQALALEYAGRPVWSAPSTVVQFALGRDVLALETDPVLSTPGCRWYALHDDGRIEAHLLRLSTCEEVLSA